MADRPPWLGHLPHGVQDLVLGEAARRRQAESTLRDLFSRWAYAELIPPTFEYAQNLTLGVGLDLHRSMYQFFDREGHTLALRADFTTQVARIAASKLFDQSAPLRCCYIGSVFRHEEPQAGRQREFTQAGVELLGANTAAADAEVVALAVAALEALEVADFQISLGHVGLFRALTASLPPSDVARIRQATDRRNTAGLAAALDAAGVTGRRRALLAQLPELVGGPEILEEARPLAGAATEAAEALTRLYRLLQVYGVADRVILDLGEIRGMEYYTGITFRGLARGLGWPVLSGGRYDELVGQFGRPLAAVGFGLGIERLMLVRAQSARAPAPHLVMHHCEHPGCLALVRCLREAGCRVELDVLGRSGSELLAHARRQGAGYVLRCRTPGSAWLLYDGERERVVSSADLIEEISP